MTLRRVTLGIFIFTLLGFACTAWSLSLAKEIQIGGDAAKDVEKEMPPSKNQQWQDSIKAMGQKFVPFVKRKDIPYHFMVVTDKEDTINAFSLPGGYVYFTEHMWKILTPDERAAVMAHEITHCDQRHGIDEMLKSQQRLLWTLPLIVLSGGAGAEALMWGNVIIDARYSRKMEREADELGIQLDKRAGFNPAGAVTSMKKLLGIEADMNRYEISAIFADHPDTKKRVDYLTDAALKLGAKSAELELKIVDDPSRIGNIVRKVSDMGVMYARTTQPLNYGDKVLIKKMLWDDDKQALTPKTVAVAVVLTPGRFPSLLLANYKDYNFTDVMVGDGIYPAPPEPMAPPEAPAAPAEPDGKKSVKFWRNS